jgi:regulator of protease activity HflC (stomatin/prohibitin superfamily)
MCLRARRQQIPRSDKMKIFDIFKEEDIVIHDYEAGLLYENGEFRKVLEKGAYVRRPLEKEIIIIDKRTQSTTISGQEILTKDKLNLRLNILVRYKVTDPVKARHEVENYNTSVYQDVQMTVRGIVGEKDLDELISIRKIFDENIQEELRSKCDKYGIKIESIELKDIILPGNLKEILIKEVEAKKEAEIALIKARGEVASTRALINAANLVREHPELLELKMMESLGKLADRGNSTIVPLPSDIFDRFKRRQ